jgi:phosphoglycerate dehydrogenase-like enzyme
MSDPSSTIPVLVTETEYRRAETVFRSASGFTCIVAPAEEEALAAAVSAAGVRHAIVGGRPYVGPLYDALPRGGVLARFGVGHDGIDKARATRAGLLCTNTPGVLDQSVAETSMLLIAAAARHLVPMASDLRQGRWSPVTGIELAGKTLAIIGIGRIGQALARIAARGYGMRVIGCGRPGKTMTPLPDVDMVTNDFHEAVRDADFVCLLMPSTPDTRRYISTERLAVMPSRAWLVNVARGAVVDEVALYDALAAGRIAGAALDVFEHEPYVPVDPSRDLRRLPNVLLVPHVGSSTTEANRGMATRALQNVRLGHAGRYDAMDLLNRDVLASL